MGWVFLAVVVIAVAFVFWDMFIRGKKGPALAWSVAAMITLSAGGVAQGAEGGPWRSLASSQAAYCGPSPNEETRRVGQSREVGN